MHFLKRLESRLELHSRNGLTRSRITLETPQSPLVEADGKVLVNFCSNDYLGLAASEELAVSMSQAIHDYGCGSGASHLVCGHMQPHRELEARLQEYTGAERVLLFSTGYMANLAVVTTLANRHSLILSDRLNHASLVDACILSRARVRRYRHADPVDAASRVEETDKIGKVLITTDSIFSMDGDVAPIPELQNLAEQYESPVIIDDAHGFGVLGDGRGSLRHFDCGDNAIMMGTLGKAAGVFGAFVAASTTVIEALIQFARPYIYTTALPPAVAAAACRAVELMQSQDWRRQKLGENISHFRTHAAQSGIELAKSLTPIQPVLLGDESKAMAASASLRNAGFMVTAIRPPTVPKGSARLRITLCANHQPEQIDRLVNSLAGVLRVAA